MGYEIMYVLYFIYVLSENITYRNTIERMLPPVPAYIAVLARWLSYGACFLSAGQRARPVLLVASTSVNKWRTAPTRQLLLGY